MPFSVVAFQASRHRKPQETPRPALWKPRTGHPPCLCTSTSIVAVVSSLQARCQLIPLEPGPPATGDTASTVCGHDGIFYYLYNLEGRWTAALNSGGGQC